MTPCPACDELLELPAQSCSACGLRLVGLDAARLWVVNDQLYALELERDHLLASCGNRSRPHPEFGWPGIAAFPANDRQMPARVRRNVSPQQLLLSLGAALLLVASIVFVAVAWNNLGLAVQVAAMLGATSVATWSSAFVARRHLRATAESLGAVASGLVAVDLWAVWQFDILGVRHLSGPAYAAISAVVAALLLAGASRLVRGVAVFGVAGALSAQVPVLAAMLALAGPHRELRALIAAALVGTAGFDRVLAVRIAGWPRATARTFAAAGWLVGTILALASASARNDAGTRTAMVVLAIAAFSALPPLTRDVPANIRNFVAASGIAAAVLDARFIADFAGGRVGLCVLGLLGGALIAMSSRLRSLERWLLSSGVGIAVVSGAALVGTHPRSLAWIVIAGGGAGAVCHGVLAAHDRRVSIPIGAAALAVALTSALASFDVAPADVASVAVVCGSIVLGVAALRQRAAEQPGLLVVAAMTAGAGMAGLADLHSFRLLGLALAMTGVAWLLLAALPEHERYSRPALVILGIAQLVQLQNPAVRPVEYVAVGLALVALCVSRVYSVVSRARIGVAAIGLGLLPSAIVSASDPGVTRAIAVVLVSVVVLWMALRRAAGPLSAICLSAIALSDAGLGLGHQFGVLAVLLATVGVMLGVSARMRPQLVGATPLAALMFTGTLAASLAAARVPPGPAGVCLVAGATVLLTASVLTSVAVESAAFDALAIVTAIAAITTSSASDQSVWVQCTLAIAGASWLAVGWRRWQAIWVVSGIVALSAALFYLLGNAHVVVIEAYTLPLAALLLAIGLVIARKQALCSSWVIAGPALVVGLVPSSFVALADQHPLRPMAVIAASSVVILVGLRLRWQALIAPATMCLVAVAISQLAPYAVGAPRWLTLGGVGVALIATGARYEERLKDARSVRAWLLGLR